MSKSKVAIIGQPPLTTVYATLEDDDGFSVVIWQTGNRFKLVWRDTRNANSSHHVIFTKYWETKEAADHYIALYKQIKGVKEENAINSNHQGKPVQRRAGQ